MPRPSSAQGRNAPRPRITGITALAVTAALLTTAGPAAAAVRVPARPPAAARPARTPADLQTLAAEQARRTGKPVTVAPLTTPTSLTQAMPDGRFKMTTSALPVRAWTAGGWRALDPALRRDGNGTWSPAVSASQVAVSGGGTAPLALMTTQARSLALYWPGRLPRPVISGTTATYRSVLPGVDLRVTVTSLGGFSDVLVIRDRAAASDPGLRRLTLTAVSTGGLRLSSGPGGVLQAATSPAAVPVFTAPAPLMWDSATTGPALARGTRPAASPAAAMAVPGSPAVSTPGQPGRHAHAAWVRSAVSAPVTRTGGRVSQALTLIPSAGLLDSPSTVFPAYVDPSWYPSGGSEGWWASDASAYPGTNYWDKTADPSPNGYLQVGYGGSFTAHTFVQMVLHADQLDGAVIHSSVLQFTQENAGSCTNSPVELWWAGNPAAYHTVSWNQEPAWLAWHGTGSLQDGAITSVSQQYGYGSCKSGFVDFDITSFMQDQGPAGPSTMTFGLKATDTSDVNGWREFSNAPGAITMTTYYDKYPGPQSGSMMSPGGACQDSSAAKTIVGNDDITLETVPYTPQGGSLSTTFVIKYGSTTELTSTITGASGQVARLPVPRTTITGWHADGKTAPYQYSWYTTSSDGLLDNSDDTGIGSPANPCLFTFDPSAPQAPGIAPPAAIPGSIDGAVGVLGKTATFTIGPCTTALDTPPVACAGTAPANFTYQVDDGPPVNVPVSTTSPTQQLVIPLTQVGPNIINISGLSAGGNPGPQAGETFTVDAPATSYPDGDYAGTGHPDLITVGDGTGTTSQPGLWMAESDGAGLLGTPIDIGTRGTGLNTIGTPKDWAGTDVLHGDFTGNHVQDIVAYYPAGYQNQYARGTLQMIAGPGSAALLDPQSGKSQADKSNPLADLNWGDGTEAPAEVVAAGNASGLSTGMPDLLGILGDGNPTQKYELNLYTATPGAFFSTAYGTIDAKSTTGPQGIAWSPAWTLQVAQPGGQPVLLALYTANGQLWESVNPHSVNPQAASAPIGMTGSTWTQVTGGPWGPGSGPRLVQADVNSAGNIELWTVNGGTATAWTLPPPSSTTGDTTIPLTQGTATTLVNPGHEWPLTDGPVANGSLIDTESTSGNATVSGGVTFPAGTTTTTDPALGPVASFDGTKATAITLPAGTLQDTTASHAALQSMTLTLRFRAQPGTTGIIAGTSTGTLSATGPWSNSSAPILYLGTDGRLYAQFPSAHAAGGGVLAPDINPLISPAPVDDGQWHTVTLVADGASHDQILYLDSNTPVHLPQNGSIDGANQPVVINPGQTTAGQAYSADQVTIGGGIFSDAGWVNADATNGKNGTTHLSEFTGDIADVALYPQALTPAQLPRPAPAPVTSTFTVTPATGGSTFCLDNWGGSATSPGSLADGNKIQIWGCDSDPSQNWALQPDGTIQLAAAPGHCLDVAGGAKTAGTLVDLHACTGGGAQQWQVLSDGALANTQSGMCLNDPNGNTTAGTQLQIFYCNGTQSQAWYSAARPQENAAVGTIVSVGSGLCTDNKNGSSTSPGNLTNGNVIQVYTCNGYPSQQWVFEPDGTIRLAANTGWCLDNTTSGSADGNPIDLYTCNSTGAQQWAHQDTGDMYNAQTGKCIRAYPNTLQTQLQLWTCNQNSTQTWIYPSTYNH